MSNSRDKTKQRQSREASFKKGTYGRAEHKGKAATSHKDSGGKMAR